MSLKSYLLKRIAYSVVLMFFALSLNFVIFRMAPGDPIQVVASGTRLEPEMVERLIELWGLREPLHVQYIRYMRSTLTWDFGYSYYSLEPVSREIRERLPNTLLLMGTSLLFAALFGTLFGIYAAYKRGSLFDMTAVTVSLFSYALPTFWMGLILIYVMGYLFGLFPLAGTISRPPPLDPIVKAFDVAWHLFLPGLTLFLFSYGSWLLMMRSTLLEALHEDYITTARAKGVTERGVLFRHAFRNAMLPLVTNVALTIPGILNGAILTETVFSWRGLGLYTWGAIQFNDYPVLQALFFIFALVTVVCNFIVDVVYGFIDPRIKY
ncbi:MAG: ABC transporter permease [Candidatus Bathyarchaeota archaeon]|nr:ABC transporter permease [Candidatus Bathyarchaeota archaeon]MCW3991116.1 ABC transporter permease [Candidatus Bathyarchaeota archaeon]